MPRVSGDRRKPVRGFDYADGQPFIGDSIAHEITWKGKTLDALKGRSSASNFF